MKRGKSLFGSAFDHKQSLLKDQIQQKQYSKILQDLKCRPQRLKQFIVSYRMATSQEQQHQVYIQFRKQQQVFKRYRQQLKDQFQQLKGQDQEHNYVRGELVQVIKQEMNLDLQMNQLVQKKKREKQGHALRWLNLQGKTTRVQNALQDILQKSQQIKQLQASVRECLELLEIIGVLVKQQGDKIKVVEQRVSQANYFVDLAQKKINIAKIRMEKSNRKKCCVIIIGLIAICLILVALFGLKVINL